MEETLKSHELNKIEGEKEFISFNWNQIATDIKDFKGEWYLVAFRSIGNINTNNDSLSIAEENAYNEAEKHGGLLK
ncbi:16934_t:CDS:2, partial [Dentiscutata erythropus]